MKLIPTLAALGLLFSGTSLQAADATQETASPAAAASTEAAAEAPAAEAVTPEPETSTPAASTEATTTETTATAETEQAGFSRGSVVRSIFTSAIDNREPTDKLENSAEANRIYYFTELRDMSGQTATHRWEHDGKVMAEVKFDVRGPRWRVWSSKSFAPGWAGDWKVSVLNGAGEMISEEMITMAAVPEEPATEAAPAAAEVPAEAQPESEEFQPPVNPDMIQ
jgi:hypothetical protein